MADPTNSSSFQAILDAIYSTLEAERSSGRISSVAAVGDTWLNEVNMYPYVYVDLDGFDEDLGPAIRQRTQTVKIMVGVAYESAVSLSDARRNLKSLLDDGNGNGLCPILRDPANFTWGQRCNWSTLSNAKIYDNGDKNDNTAAQFVAYAVMLYTVNLYMNPAGAVQ